MNKLEELMNGTVDSVVDGMDDCDIDGVEVLYFNIVSAVTGVNTTTLWDEWTKACNVDGLCETEAVNKVGEKYGFPSMWSMIRNATAYMLVGKLSNNETANN